MKAKKTNDIIGKIIALTKQIYLKEPEDGSGRVERFMPGKKSIHPLLRSSLGVEWWVNSGTFKCCEDIANITISFDTNFQGCDKKDLSKLVLQTFREIVNDRNIFIFEHIFFKSVNTIFEARIMENPNEFASYLWDEIYSNFSNALAKWLTMYPLRLVKTDSFVVGFDGLTLLRSNDQEQWQLLADRYKNAKSWMPSTGIPVGGGDTMKDFLLTPTWLVCEASGTGSSARRFAADNMRTFIAILLSYLNETIPDLLTKSGADAASYSIQFPEDESKAEYGSISATIGILFPPLLVNGLLNIPSDILFKVQDWYKLRSNSSELVAQRATTAAHFIHYGIISDNLERFIHFFIALDALFGERSHVEENLKKGIGATFFGQADWMDRTDKLFDLRNQLIHGGISGIERWDGLDHYRRRFKSNPMKDIQIAAMTALRVYFSSEIFDQFQWAQL